jgi:hypothetical protein
MENIFLEEYLKKINSILSWFNELSKKLDLKYWLDLTTLSQIYYNNKLERETNVYISLESKYFPILITYLIENKIQFKFPKYLFSKINYLHNNEISFYIEIEELIIYFWKKEGNNLINDLINNNKGLKIDYNIIYELKTKNYNNEEYSIPNNIYKYLELIKLLKRDNNLEIKKLNYKLNDNFFERKIIENKNILNSNEKNTLVDKLVDTKVDTKIDIILKKRNNYWEKYKKSLLNDKEIDESKMVKNIEKKNNVIPKFFSL